MKKLFPIWILCLIPLASCLDKAICPAYQSYYLLDEDKRDNMFAYFGEDSLPKQQEGIVSKNMFGIIEKPNYFTVANVTVPKNEYKARDADLQTIKMEVIYPSDEEDSLNLEGEIPESQATNQYESELNLELPEYISDTVSTVKDTAKVKPEYHYNVDQLVYMDLIGNDIMDARQERIDSLKAKSEELQDTKAKEGAGAPKKKKGFFKRIFSKKQKEQVTDDSTEEPSLPDEDGQEPSEGKKKKAKKEKSEKPKKERFWNKKKDKENEGEKSEN